MHKNQMFMALLFPFLAVITIAVFAGGLGVIFMVLETTALEQWAVMILGVALVVAVPTVAALVQRAMEKE